MIKRELAKDPKSWTPVHDLRQEMVDMANQRSWPMNGPEGRSGLLAFRRSIMPVFCHTAREASVIRIENVTDLRADLRWIASS